MGGKQIIIPSFISSLRIFAIFVVPEGNSTAEFRFNEKFDTDEKAMDKYRDIRASILPE